MSGRGRAMKRMYERISIGRSVICAFFTILCVIAFSVYVIEARSCLTSSPEVVQKKVISAEVLECTQDEDQTEKVVDIIDRASQETGIENTFLAAVMEVESRFNVHAYNPVDDSYGLMQLNPEFNDISILELRDPYEGTLYAAKKIRKCQDMTASDSDEPDLYNVAYVYYTETRKPQKQSGPAVQYVKKVMEAYHDLKR